MKCSTPSRHSKKDPDFSRTRIGLALIFSAAAVANSIWGDIPVLALPFIVASLGCVGCNATVNALRDVAVRFVEGKRVGQKEAKRQPPDRGRERGTAKRTEKPIALNNGNPKMKRETRSDHQLPDSSGIAVTEPIPSFQTATETPERL
jgi:hypothetical protein